MMKKNYTEEKILTFDLRPGCKEGTKITFEKRKEIKLMDMNHKI